MLLSKQLIRQTIAVCLIVAIIVLIAYLGIKKGREGGDNNVMPALSEELLMSLDENTDPTISGLYNESSPATGDNVTETETYTSRYLATLSENISREEILNKSRLDAFISLNKGELLPAVSIGEGLITEVSTTETRNTYLDQITPSHNPLLHIITSDMIDQAFADQLESGEMSLRNLILKMYYNIETLKKIPVPEDLVELHKKNLAANQSLLDNATLIMAVDEDLIGSLVGTYNIGQLGLVFREISAEINHLRSL